MIIRAYSSFLLLSAALTVSASVASDSPAARGKAALLGESHIESMWGAGAYENAWKLWGLKEKPAEYAAAFRERYGLHPAPYENGGLPMGIRRAQGPVGEGLAIDCMLCHGSSILGTSYVGLPNVTLDLPLLFHEMPQAGGGKPFPWPFPLGTTRGTTNAGAVAAFVLGFRNPDMTPRVLPVYLGWRETPDLDPPAWWLWKRKKTIYQDGGTDARSTRSTMQFLIAGNTAEELKVLESTWDAVRDYIWTLEPPKYPFAIDADLAKAGETIFRETCARCHGTYGPGGEYPNKIIPIETIGTDHARYDGISQAFRDYYDASWLGKKYPTRESEGYQAPPLDGIWATAPYLHNGSVPTVWGVLNAATRPKRFRLPPTTGREAYDPVRLGWKVEVLDNRAAPRLPAAGLPVSDPAAMGSRTVYDTGRFGKGNGGHTFGDHLSDNERTAVIEYLKTL